MALATPTTVPSILFPEILGFSPQSLLDDIINSANNAIYHCVGALEPFLYRWAEQRSSLKGSKEDLEELGEAQIDQGLVAFQTLLEQHVDIAFDFFEVWSRRNIFAFAPDLPIVVPHQRGLDLDTPVEIEVDLFTEIEEIRRKIENQRRLRSLFLRAQMRLEVHHARANKRLADLTFLEPLLQYDITSLPKQIMELYESLKSLPLDSPTRVSVIDPRKRPWETSQEGYLQWAVHRLVDRARAERKSIGGGPGSLLSALEVAESIGTVQEVRSALAAARPLDEGMDQDRPPAD